MIATGRRGLSSSFRLPGRWQDFFSRALVMLVVALSGHLIGLGLPGRVSPDLFNVDSL